MRKKFLTREDVRKHTFRITSNAKRSGDSKIFLNWNQKHFGNEKKNNNEKKRHIIMCIAPKTLVSRNYFHASLSRILKMKSWITPKMKTFARKKNSNFFPCYNFENFIGEKSKFLQANHHLVYLSRTQPTREKINCFEICLLKGRVENGIMEFDFLVIFYDWTCHACSFLLIL